MYSVVVTLVMVAGVFCEEDRSGTTSTTGGTTGSGGLSTGQMIEIGVPVGGTLLTVIVMILVATGIFKCWKRCLNVDLERQPLISSPSTPTQNNNPGIAKATIDAEFAKLVLYIHRKLARSNINIRDLQLFIKTLFPSMTSPQSDIQEIFGALSSNKLWDSWNYLPLKVIVEQFAVDDEEIASWIEDYEKKFKRFQETTRIIDCIGTVFVDSVRRDNEREISVTLEEANRSLEHIENIWNEFADRCGIPLHVTRLDSIREGSVSVVWRIPSRIAFKILEAPPPSDEFCHKHGIIRVEYDGEAIYQEGRFAVSGLGLKSATTNQVSKFTVRTYDTHDQSTPVSAQLKSLVDGSVLQATVVSQTPSIYKLSYTPTTRGRHQLTVRVNNTEIGTFQVFVKHPPTQLGTPVRAIEGVRPMYIAVGDKGELFVTEYWDGQYTVLDSHGQIVLTIGSKGNRPFGDGCPTGIATDGEGNLYIASGYIASAHKVQKFNRRGEVVKSVGKKLFGHMMSDTIGEFNYPQGVRFHNHQVYVCDCNNGRVQVFNSNLNFVQSFGTHGDGPGQLKYPRDIDFDTQGNIYILDYSKHQVLMFSESGHYLHHFGQKGQGEGELNCPYGLCVSGDYVYVTEYNRISVFRTSGEFVHSFGKFGSDRGELNLPFNWGIAIDRDGFVFVCDPGNKRIQVF